MNSVPTLIDSDKSCDSRGALFVDLDGSLIRGDVLRNACFAVVGRPWLWPSCGAWLLRGRAYFKHRLSLSVVRDPAVMRFRASVLDLISHRKAAGDRIVLASATAARWASDVAAHLKCFDDVLASTSELNLKGVNKLAAIQAYCAARKISRFGYVGDSCADLPIWTAADECYFVGDRRAVLAGLDALQRPYQRLPAD
jgi:phosphoserine phosphatase